MTIIEDNSQYQIIRRTSPAGYTDELVPKAGSLFETQVRGEANRATIEQQLVQGLAALQQIIDAPDVSFTTLAQAQAAMRQMQAGMRAQARQSRRLTRLALGLLDAAD